MEALDRDGTHYSPCRVAYLSNLVAKCNYGLWDAFDQRWNRATVTPENIPTILADWAVIYDNSQKPENALDCYMPDDIASTAEVEVLLRDHAGFVLAFRVD